MGEEEKNYQRTFINNWVDYFAFLLNIQIFEQLNQIKNKQMNVNLK